MSPTHALAGAALLIAAVAVPAAEQPYPVRPVRLVVPYPPGGGTETMARVVGQRLAERLGYQVVVDNRPGGGTIIGTDIVAKAPPDGHTLLANTAAITINSGLHAKLPYDLMRDLAPVMQLATLPNVLVVNNAVPARTLRELIDHGRGNGARYNCGSSGSGSVGHLACELLKVSARVDVVHVPYRGGGPMIVDLIAGQLQVSFASGPSAMQFIHGGKLRALGVAMMKRSIALQDVPTMAEAGLPGFDASNWQGMWVPAGTPPAIALRLNRELKVVLGLPDVQKQLAANGFETTATTGAEFGTILRAELAKWSRLIRESGAKVE